ncbi:MAG: ketoacyl-ACP synthase III [Deltaproteobacteria bacterium]|nr:ketoacyl-ACP synthase III [Deltaproteobacteria bacterium]
MRRAVIAGTGLHVPERVVANQYFSELYGKDMDTFLRTERNIYTRHYMAENEATSDLLVPACQQALSSAGLLATDVDLIIISTDTPDYLSPSTASVVQYRLGASRAGTFDVNSACAGFVTAVDIASHYISADERYRAILVAGGYGMSKFINWDDYKVASLFADGAGAVVLKAGTGPEGFLTSTLYADGQYHDYMGIYAGGTAKPITHSRMENKEHLLCFAKKIPIETNATHWPRLAELILERIGKRAQDVACYFFTQINIQSIHATLDSLGVPHEKSHNVMDRYGYTGSACIPMAMHDAVLKHKLKKGDLILTIGSGGGLAMAAAAFIWGYDT